MALLGTLTDNFNDNSLDTGKWAEFEAGSATITEVRQRMEVAYPSSSTSSTDGDISSVSTYDLTASYAFLEVITVPSSSTNADAELRISVDSSNWFRIIYEAGTVFFQRRISASTTTIDSLAYDATAHRWWRISESGGDILWETSPNGSDWTTRATYTYGITITAMSVLIAGTCFQNETDPGEFIFDNFNTLPALEELTDNFDDNSVDVQKWLSFGGTHVQETGSELRITTSMGFAYYGLESQSSYNLTSSYALIHILSAGAIGSMNSLEMELKVIKEDDVDELFITISGDGTITSAKTVGSVTTFLAEPQYDPNVHKYLRIKEDSGTIYWEYSTDGLTFYEMYSESSPFDITSVKAVIQAGTFEEEQQITTVRYDNFNLLLSDTSDSNLIQISEIDRKHYSYKVYDKDGNFIREWRDVASELHYSQEINSPGSAIEVELARNSDTKFKGFDTRITVAGDTRVTVSGDTRVALQESISSIGEGTDVDLRHRVDIYVFYGGQAKRVTYSGDTRVTVSGDVRVADIGAPNGRKKFSGYISRYNSRYGNQETTKLTLLSFGAELGNYLLKSGSNTTVTYSSQSPSVILQDVLDKFTAAGGTVDYDSSSVDNPGTVVSYTFRTNTVLEAVQKVIELSPSDWYWYLDMAGNILHLHKRQATAKHTFVLGKHIGSVDLERTIEDLVNRVIFVGGDTGSGSNLLNEYSDSTSSDKWGEGLYRYADSRVTSATSSQILSEGKIAELREPVYRAQAVILSEVYDIETINVGDTVRFRNFGNFFDNVVLQVNGLRYEPDRVTLQLGSLLPNVSKRVEDIRRNLTVQESENDPSAPS